MLIHHQMNHIFCLSPFQWETMRLLLPTIRLPPVRHHELVNFILCFCYLLDIDLSVLVGDDQWRPCMNHFSQYNNNQWWFLIKNTKHQSQKIAVNKPAFEVLMRWRHHLGLTTPPLLHESTPLLPKAKWEKPFINTPTLKRSITPYFKWIANQLRQKNLIEEAEYFLEATYKWLRRS